MKSFTAGSDASAPPRPAAAKPASKIADLKVRVLSALVLGPVVLLAVWAGGWVFQALLAVCAFIALGEWVLMVAPERMPEAFWHSMLAMAVVLVNYALGGPLSMVVQAVVFGIIVQVSVGGRPSWLLGFGIPYVAAGIAGLAWLREHPGLPLVIFCLFAVWATDIGAYAAGRAIGGPKLAPRISPKKTWAGLIGGMVAAAVFGVAVAYAAGAAKPWLALLVAPLLAVVGQAGDLFESWVKRRYNVKDSSNLIPGHGGLLDRIDGLLVAAPVLAVFHATLGKSWQWW